MKEHPIIFSGEGTISAILSGAKTQTRRAMKRQPTRTVNDHTMDAKPGEVVIYRDWPHRLAESRGRNKRDAGELTPTRICCPYGKPGDLLWVKEGWRGHFVPGTIDSPESIRIAYRAGGHKAVTAEQFDEINWQAGNLKWRSPRFMFKWASRIWLEVLKVWPERVQDISHSNIHAEGVFGDTHPELSEPARDDEQSARIYFAELWDKLNAKRGYPWSLDPCVWATEFRRIERP